MTPKYKCYIASPFFDDEAKEEINIIRRQLRYFNIKCFSPMHDNLCKKDASDKEKDICFKMNLSEINNCNFMIANTRNKDMGTLIEMGYAFAKNKPIILFCPQIKDVAGFTPNLMLAKLLRGVSFTEDELSHRIGEFIDGIESPKWGGNIE